MVKEGERAERVCRTYERCITHRLSIYGSWRKSMPCLVLGLSFRIGNDGGVAFAGYNNKPEVDAVARIVFSYLHYKSFKHDETFGASNNSVPLLLLPI